MRRLAVRGLAVALVTAFVLVQPAVACTIACFLSASAEMADHDASMPGCHGSSAHQPVPQAAAVDRGDPGRHPSLATAPPSRGLPFPVHRPRGAQHTPEIRPPPPRG